MTILYTEYKPGGDSDDFNPSRFGYVIEPDGNILSLQKLQVHGEIAYERSQEVRDYYDGLDEDRKSRTMMAAELYATNDLGHVRISIAPYIGQWSIGTSYTVPLTRDQRASLKWLFDVCDMADDEVWGNSGPMYGSDLLKELMK